MRQSPDLYVGTRTARRVEKPVLRLAVEAFLRTGALDVTREDSVLVAHVMNHCLESGIDFEYLRNRGGTSDAYGVLRRKQH